METGPTTECVSQVPSGAPSFVLVFSCWVSMVLRVTCVALVRGFLLVKLQLSLYFSPVGQLGKQQWDIHLTTLNTGHIDVVGYHSAVR